jgi:DNA-binding response OmpR family regulator
MGKKVLFVDDEGDWRFMTSTYLKEAGYEVLTAKNGSEALLISDGIKLDVIVLDINLNGENGVVLMKFLKRNHPGVPVILYTGMQHDDESIQSMVENGAQQYVRKGTMDELLKAVATAAK